MNGPAEGQAELKFFKDAKTNIGTEKECPRCKKQNKFDIDRKRKDGFAIYCRKCSAEALKKWRQKDPKRACESSKKWQREHPEWEKNKWRKNNPEKAKELAKLYNKKRRSRLSVRLSTNISNSIRSSIKNDKNGLHWESIVGYTLEQLKKHLEKLFKPGMSWSNYGRRGWHIDHKIPLSVFNFDNEKDIDFKRCWSLNNLQPLWETENIRKRDKLEKPFQPFLKLMEV
jgi:hypothetical protein